MPIAIDFPTPGPVSSNFPVGGTFSTTTKPPEAEKKDPPNDPKDPKNSPTVTAYLYDSAGNLIQQISCSILLTNWTGLFNLNQSYTDCYILAQLSSDSSTDQVNGIDVVVAGGGGGITASTMAGP